MITQSFANLSHIVPVSIWLTSLLAIVIISIITFAIYKHQVKNNQRIAHWDSWLRFIIHIIKKPLLLLIAAYLVFALCNIVQLYLSKTTAIYLQEVAVFWLNLSEFIAFFWIMLNAIHIANAKLMAWADDTHNRIVKLLLPMLTTSIEAIMLLIMINMVIPELGITGLARLFLDKITKVLVIAVIGWIFFTVVNTLEQLIISQYLTNHHNDLASRKVNTQVTVLKRIILTIGMVITIASILMVFDSVKNVGAGLLTTAGIISAIGAFASQQSLGRLFAGLQIAFTQPFRIGDTVIIENEFGEIEEITLSYVVVKLWDLRRLILPTDYFTTKGLQNLTRESTQLLGTIFFYTDYSLPIEAIREVCMQLVKQSANWDGNVYTLQVTDIKNNHIEIRILVSAANTGNLWNLRCEIRENLLQYLVKHYPDALPKLRFDNIANKNQS
jgi:small-conductance mechanosensitive channel